MGELPVIQPDAVWPYVLAQLVALPLLTLVAARLVHRHPARAHSALVAGLLLTLIAPALTALAAATGVGLIPGLVIETTAAMSSAIDAADDFTGAPVLPIAAIALVTWGLLTSVLLIRLAAGFMRGAQLVRRARRDDALADAAPGLRLLLSDQIDSPAVFAWCRPPCVLLPQCFADNADRYMLDQVLRHEAAHVARHDHWWRLIAEVATCVLPWHPAVWFVRRHIYETSELACDARAIRDEPHPEDYARTLLQLTTCRATHRPALSAARSAGSSAASMERRIRAILSVRGGRDRSGRGWIAIVSLLTCTLAAGAALAQRRPPVIAADSALDADALDAAPIFAFPNEIDLGIVPPGGIGEGVIRLVNIGARPERVIARKVSCGCTTVPFEPTTLDPGDTLSLALRVEAPNEAAAERVRTVTFLFEGQAPIEVKVRLKTSG